MAATANARVTRQDGCRASHPVAASTRHYEGALAFINAAGNSAAVIAVGANPFAGIVISEADNSSGSAGDKNVEVWRKGVFELTGSGFALSDVGDALYASDDNTITKTSTNNTRIGTIVGFISATKILCRIDLHTV